MRPNTFDKFNDNKTCETFVTPEHGLDVCHGANRTRIAEFVRELPCLHGKFDGCTVYRFPKWLDPIVKILWVMFALQVFTAVGLTVFFWVKKEYRRAVFSFNNNTDHSLMDFINKDITEQDVKYGHKIFHLPNEKINKKVSPKQRIALSFMVLYMAFLALVFDFFMDVYFLHGLSTDALIDVKYIHFDERALLSMVFFEMTAFLCLPLTAYVFAKLAWKRNLRDNLYAEVIIVSLAYVLEDGPELMLQYYWVDRYAGMKYQYPDGVEFSGRATIVFSSLASLLIALIGIVNLISLYQEFTFWLKFRALRNFLIDSQNEWKEWDQLDWKTIIPAILHQLDKKAHEENIVEKVEIDMKRIRKRLHTAAYEHYKSVSNEKTAMSFDSYCMKFKVESNNIVTERLECEPGFSEEMNKKIREIQVMTKSTKRSNLILIVVAMFGLIPLIVNLLRLSSAVHQTFVWRKYKHNCLKYVVDPGPVNTVSIDQRGLHKHECWGFFEWPFFVLNGIGVPMHTMLLIGIILVIFVKRLSL